MSRTGRKTIGGKHAFEVEFCARFLLDENSPGLDLYLAAVFRRIQQFSHGKTFTLYDLKLAFKTEHLFCKFIEHFLQGRFLLAFIGDFWTINIAFMHTKQKIKVIQ